MRNLFNDWNKVKTILSGKNIFLFFDYDGTLTPIADSPDKAVFSVKTKRILQKIISNSKFKIAVISGRSISDLKNIIGIKNILYSGNHGLEIQCDSFSYKHDILKSHKITLNEIRRKLHNKLLGYAGIIIENKKPLLSIHYRLCPPEFIPAFKEIIYQTTEQYFNEGKIFIKEGKMVIELMPPIEWNKGNAVTCILNHPEIRKNNYYPFYFGDDLTDEDAFIALKGKGATIIVGKRKKTHAHYYLNDVAEVEKFLENLAIK